MLDSRCRTTLWNFTAKIYFDILQPFSMDFSKTHKQKWIIVWHLYLIYISLRKLGRPEKWVPTMQGYFFYSWSACDLPFIPRSRAAWIGVLPTSLFSLDTTVSAGWETTAQNTPAKKKKIRQTNEGFSSQRNCAASLVSH